jgi:hypothetical protein
LKALHGLIHQRHRSARNSARFTQPARCSTSTSAIAVRVLPGAGGHHQQRLAAGLGELLKMLPMARFW